MLASSVEYRPTLPVTRSPLFLSIVVFSFVACLLATCYLLSADTNTDKAVFYVEAGWLFIFGVCYLQIGRLKSLSWCGITGLITMRAIFGFGLVPAWRAYTGADMVDPLYVKAMFIVLIGFVAFWIGSVMAMRPINGEMEAQGQTTSERVQLAAISMFVLGLLVELALWKAGLHGYMADQEVRRSAAPILQWLFVFETLLPGSLVITAIELIGKKSNSVAIRATFWISLSANLILGLVSGSKGDFMMPFVLLTLVYGLTKGRFPKAALFLPLLIVILYPFVNAYRDNLNSGYRDQSNTAAGLGKVLQKSFDDAASPKEAARQSYLESGVSDTSARLSLVSSVRSIVGLPSPELLNGDEKLWMVPFYPFIPRIVWKDKPILNKAQRFSMALGDPAMTSTALTPIGDLYTYGGAASVASGMLFYGMVCQLMMNWIAKSLGPKSIFFLLSVLPPMTNLESDFFSLIAADITMVVMAMVITTIIYGGKMSDLGTRPS